MRHAKTMAETDTTGESTKASAKNPRKHHRRVGRPRVDRSKAEARIRILDAAEKLFSDRGYDASPTSAIARQAGVTPGLVFYYFPSKAELLQALIEERTILPHIAEHVDQLVALEAADSVEGMLRQAGRALYELVRGSESMVRIVTGELFHHPYIRNRWIAMLEEVLADLSDHVFMASGGAVSADSAGPLTRVFFSTIAFHAIFDPDYPSETLIADLAHLLAA